MGNRSTNRLLRPILKGLLAHIDQAWGPIALGPTGPNACVKCKCVFEMAKWIRRALVYGPKGLGPKGPLKRNLLHLEWGLIPY